MSRRDLSDCESTGYYAFTAVLSSILFLGALETLGVVAEYFGVIDCGGKSTVMWFVTAAGIGPVLALTLGAGVLTGGLVVILGGSR